MKCVICHGAEIERRKVDEEVASGKDIVCVPVEVLVCGSCGERYYDRKTKRYLEEVQTGIAAHTVNLKEIGKVMTLAA